MPYKSLTAELQDAWKMFIFKNYHVFEAGLKAVSLVLLILWRLVLFAAAEAVSTLANEEFFSTRKNRRRKNNRISQ
jgi:Mn2+/Fe2+ NRAMP family transporter